jgi:hypothetical protein
MQSKELNCTTEPQRRGEETELNRQAAKIAKKTGHGKARIRTNDREMCHG